ncbi:diguanylate cyclase [Vibrio sp. JPW-9-11-11]|uniref:GGDEF domain-containing protein n=1 Tax=Vibrio sp. JPW-9-11-11 TaxID=1416532 RepID=UPI001594E076|nr:diguanylate cyclase [Vibrio sp. JPW-9-11-11]NVD08794.1 diguanylate cyclase [Vibrio sp. JPW-9-11-11]
MAKGFEKWLGVERSHEDYRESWFVFVSLSLLSGLLAILIYYNVMVIPSYLLATIEAVGLVFCLVGHFFLWRSRNVNIAALILVLVMCTVSLLFIVGSGHSEFALAFAFLTPVVAIFVLGPKLGSLLSLFNFVVVFYVCLIDMDNWPPIPFDGMSLTHLSIVYLFLLLTAYFYESGRRRTMALLSESNRQLKVISHTDMLTQLFNRRYIETLLLEPERVQWIALVDVDDFKAINDEFGHDVGDRVLLQTARILREQLAGHAQVGRWGGEEFLIAFEVSDYAVVERRVKDIQVAIANYDFKIDRPVTISTGVAKHDAEAMIMTFRRADEALYQAKSAGKNCFYTAQSA